MITRIAAFMFVILSLPLYTLAWGVTGHRIVGEIASFYLNSRSRKEIKKILGNESLAMASNWGDFIKSDSAYDYINNWHYINVEEKLTYEQLHDRLLKDTSVNAYTKINALADSLRMKNIDLVKKRMYLRLLIHFVGDIHQPLHVGHSSDEGGGKLRLQWFGANTNLHTLWDSRLVDFQQLSYTEYATYLNHTTKEEVRIWQQKPLADWVCESYIYAQKIYSGYTGPEQKLSYDYNYLYVDVLNSQLLKGGVRLAGLLNQIFS
ncbi:MAG: S1/P1 Nuclease [Chitinophagaceae bacterium]|nr:MAG: S1/P1 Nuclease [Chitinophagaceae bacterium]